MSTVVIGAGGPRPQARIVTITEVQNNPNAPTFAPTWGIMDGDQLILQFNSQKWAEALLPLIQAGE